MHPLQIVRSILSNKSDIGVVMNIHGSNIWSNNCTSSGTKMPLEFRMQVQVISFGKVQYFQTILFLCMFVSNCLLMLLL